VRFEKITNVSTVVVIPDSRAFRRNGHSLREGAIDFFCRTVGFSIVVGRKNLSLLEKSESPTGKPVELDLRQAF
jgi:hypothetical protein